MKKKVFISYYSNTDKNKMVSLKKYLLNNEFFEPVVVDDKRSPGKMLSKKVTEEIEDCSIFIPILTRQSMRSQWVNQEIGYVYSLDNIEIIPLVDENIRNKLKGFIHNQLGLFTYISDRNNKNREARNFRKAYVDIINYLTTPGKENTMIVLSENVKKFITRIEPKIVREGDTYTTYVHFIGDVKNGFFDNYVKHMKSDFYRWNYDKNTILKTGPTDPGTIHGFSDIESSYTWDTKGWPKGKYRIHVRIYDHLEPGTKGRKIISQQIHDFEVI